MNTGIRAGGPVKIPSREELEDSMLNYCINLSNSLKSIHVQVKAALPVPLEGRLHSIEAGDWVVVKDCKRRHWRKPRWTGPFQV